MPRRTRSPAPLRIILLTPARRFIANRFGLGYQIPLGLVLLGGPLIDAGYDVQLVDNDVLGLDDAALVQRLAEFRPDCILIGHSSSTAAHPVAMASAHALRQAFPQALIVYGGAYPSYAAREVLAAQAAVDVIVHGEGEATVLELVAAWSRNRADLHAVLGITWRSAEGEILSTPRRPPIVDLDLYRPGWELVDWPRYELFGVGRAAGLQFSRGCTLTCTYCGQWSFWRKWRHRSVASTVAQLELLVTRYQVRIVWFADENFAADRESAIALLEAIAARKLGLSLNLNMTAADVLRDAELLPLYKRAGVDNIIMGVESLDDATVARVRKNNPFELSCQAARLARAHGIVGLVNIIYGLQSETPASLWRTFRQILKLDPDVLNAVYLTPHHWTADGRRANADAVIQPDQRYFTYRNQVLDTPGVRPWQLFAAIKLTEALFHLRPRALWRMAFGADAQYRQILRAYLKTGVRVVAAEIWEFLFQARRVPAGSLRQIPGFPAKGASGATPRPAESLPTIPVDDPGTTSAHSSSQAVLPDSLDSVASTRTQ